MSTFKAKELIGMGYPEPLRGESQDRYVWRICAMGFSLNTRQARCAGIANLNSVASTIHNSRRLPISRERCAVIDPATGKLDSRRVLRVWCEPADIAKHQAKKSAPSEPEA